MRIAAELGSDVPFALVGGTAIGSGRGEVVVPLITVGEYWWVVLESEKGLSTPSVYGEFDVLHAGASVPEPEIPDALMAALRVHDVAALGASLSNDLQAAALRLRPELGLALEQGRWSPRTARSCPAPGRAACSSARAARTPSRWPGDSGPSASGRCPSPPGRCTAPGWSPPTTDGSEMAVANLVSLERVHKAYGVRPLLDDVSLGVGATDRIGVVGRNGDGKTTLLKLLGGLEEPDEGGSRATGACALGYSPRATTSTRRPRSGSRCSRAAPTTSGPPTRPPGGRGGAARRGLARPRRRGPVRR